MKRIAMVAGAILLLSVLGIYLTSWQVTKDKVHGRTKVGMIMIGTQADSSWNQAHWQGIQDASQNLDLSLDCEELGAADEAPEAVERMIQQGCKIIISTSVDFEEAMLDLAQNHPNVYFFQAMGSRSKPNLSSYMGRMYQMRYLAGIAAGRQTKNHAVGYVATEPIPEVVRGVDAFTLGVRKSDPSAVVYLSYTNSWTDHEKIKAVSESLLQRHPDIDVLEMHADSYEPLDVAQAHGIYMLGCNVDASERYPQLFLGAPVWHWNIFYTKYIREALNNKFEGRNYLVGANTGIVAFTASANLDEDTKRVIEDEHRKLSEGEYDVFYGPILDNQGTLRVAEGESLSDRTLLQEIDWYVEGVVLP